MKLFFSFKTHEATTADYVETTLSPEEARDRALQCCKRLIKDLPASAIQKIMYAHRGNDQGVVELELDINELDCRAGIILWDKLRNAIL